MEIHTSEQRLDTHPGRNVGIMKGYSASFLPVFSFMCGPVCVHVCVRACVRVHQQDIMCRKSPQILKPLFNSSVDELWNISGRL